MRGVNVDRLCACACSNWMPLANWSDAAIHALSYISRTEDFAYNRVIVEDSQRNEWLWFIAKVSQVGVSWGQAIHILHVNIYRTLFCFWL